MSSHNGHACPNCRQRNLTECQPDCKFRSIPMQGAVVDHHPVEAFATGSTSSAGGSSSDLDPQVQCLSGAVAAAQPESGDPPVDVPDPPICSDRNKDKLLELLDDAAPIATPVGTPIQEPAPAVAPQSDDLAADVTDAAPAASPVGSPPVVPLSAEGSPVEAFGTGSTSVAGGSSSDLDPQVQSASADVAAAQPKSGDPAADVPDEPVYSEVDTNEVMNLLADSAPISPVEETVEASLQSGDVAADVPVAAPAASPIGSSSVVPESAASGVAPGSPEFRDDPKLLVWGSKNEWSYVSRSVETVSGGVKSPDAAVVDSSSSDWSGGTGWTNVSGSSFGGGGGGNGGGGGSGGGGNGGAPTESQSSS
uniref:Uncharacterized protein n=1 Tax=Kalanchoe fedtschenkoi TaxID=63787 RepID=A0A7N0UZL1_KALFE